MVIFGEKTEKTPTKEAGRVSSDRHLSLPSSKSIPPVPAPQPCSRPSTVAFYPLPLFSVDQTDLPLQTSSPTPHSILYRSLQLWHVFLGTSRHCGSSLLLPHSRSHMPLSPQLCSRPPVAAFLFPLPPAPVNHTDLLQTSYQFTLLAQPPLQQAFPRNLPAKPAKEAVCRLTR